MDNFVHINANTRYCGLLGYPVRHSASPSFQNAALSFLHLNWRYLAMEVHPKSLFHAIEGAKSMGFIGLNLTVPHKETGFKLANKVNPTAQILGAINTICFEGLNKDGEWLPIRNWKNDSPVEVRSVGYYTDSDAITASLKENFGFVSAQKSILILGAGGAGRVAALRLSAEGAKKIYIINRTVQKAENLAEEIHSHYPGTKVILQYPDPSEKVDLILNATSLGLKSSDPIPLDINQFSMRQAKYAFDMIYRPAETPFLTMARQSGCQIANGINMLLYQGAASLELWTGLPAPIEIMRKALIENIYHN